MTKTLPTLPDAYNLLHEGSIALAKAERFGVHIDEKYCKNKLRRLERQTARLHKKILQEPEVKEWKRVYKSKFKLTSDDQLADVLYNRIGIKPPKVTKKSTEDNQKGSVDQEALNKIDLPFIKMILETRKIKTAWDDLSGILAHSVRGTVRPNYTLHFADTYRSTCKEPNLQNMPIRDPDLGKIVRKAFIPRDGRVFVEIDYGGIEVHGASWYHKDPVMLKYLSDPAMDMHRDMAAQIYMLENAPPQYWKDKSPGMGKDVRYCGKNKYVFPEFYGSWWKECAKNLWASISDMSLKDPEGVPLARYLKTKGIRSFRAFEKHIEEVEDDFWGRRFKVYQQWKDNWYEAYEEKGYFDTLTGFRCQGLLRRNQVINYPVQGVAFHCLLWSLIEITKELEKRGLRSRIVMQIHDSIILDALPSELNEVMDICHTIMIDKLKKHWQFIITPIEIEADISPVGTTWHDKKGVEQYGNSCSHCGISWLYKIENDLFCPGCGDQV